MRCNAADLKFISLALRFKTPHFIHPVLPSTPYSALYPWAHESLISDTSNIFRTVISSPSVMHSNGSGVSKTRVTFERSNSLAGSP